MLSGGSLPSLSLTPAARTVTVHVSLLRKSTSGLTVQLVGPPLTATVCAPEVAQEIVTDALVMVTGSLKVRLMSVFVATCVAPFVGVFAMTLGAASIENEKT